MITDFGTEPPMHSVAMVAEVFCIFYIYIYIYIYIIYIYIPVLIILKYSVSLPN